MSFDDDSTDDSAGFRPPPHPDDRLWRHPSELHGTPRKRAGPVAHGPWGTAAVAAAGVVLVAAGASVVTAGLRDRAAEHGPVTQAAIGPTDSDAELPEYAIANPAEADDVDVDVVHRVGPSVVRVVSGTERGSGVVIDDDGVLLTSAAVVGTQSEVTVLLSDGRQVTGDVRGIDPLSGVALVDLPEGEYSATELSDLEPADLGGEAALSLGVDEQGRLVLSEGGVAATPTYVERLGLPRLDGVLAVDTVLNPAAQGGPVIDDAGDLIGLATWADDAQSYITPVSTLRKVVDDLLASGSVQHTFLGIDGYDVTDNGWPAGVGVAGVDPTGPSAEVLRPDDVIVAIDRQPVSHMSALVAELRHHDPGDVVRLSYRRAAHDGELTRPVVLAQRPASLDSGS